MPVIMFYGPVNALEKEKKKELVKLLTDSAVKVTGIPASEFTVLLRATTPDLVGIGGELLCDLHARK
jgi:4-oxalocrotonate tautomerase family enzyme